MRTIDVEPRQIRMARAAAGLTQDELAERSGVSRVTIANLEGGKIADPRVLTLRALIRAREAEGVVVTDRGVELQPKP